jgi:hypothetical protein
MAIVLRKSRIRRTPVCLMLKQGSHGRRNERSANLRQGSFSRIFNLAEKAAVDLFRLERGLNRGNCKIDVMDF